MKRNRPDLGNFVPGSVYRHSATGELVEFVGIAFAARAEDTEDIAVFRPVTRRGAPITADRAGYDRGETFEPVRVADWDVLDVAEHGAAPAEVGRIDRDDIFGLRRALAPLPDDDRETFLQQWSEIGLRCEYDVTLVRTAVVRAAHEARTRAPRLADAWATVAAAMAGYLAWRDDRYGRRPA
ncbi:MAG TPA: hypothetical protein VFC99_11435 [Acidimicrobiia bacterium]|nr:hypothetical protein [Acidimicrobiia bacterium]